ncbi:hypothetical protein TWF696_000178 [Orbilia brochopaga]|uniref:Uncharacterized protein n=1 Tax=Orbilia brochopaga TaxID=3140254 RepID=A0AAV9VD00_9PEZI
MSFADTLKSYEDKVRGILEKWEVDPIVFEGVEPALAQELSDLLSGPEFSEGRNTRMTYDVQRQKVAIRMSTFVQGCVLDFMTKAWLTWSLPPGSDDTFLTLGSPAYNCFLGEFAGTIKQPSYCVVPVGAIFPTLVIESGLKESYTDLCRDKDIWFKGSGGAVKVVMLIKAEQIDDKIIAFLEIWRAGSPTAKRIHLLPDLGGVNEEEDPFLTLGELYGDTEPPSDCSRNQELRLSLYRIRWALEMSRS